MSIALLVRFNRPESPGEIERASSIALRDILSLDHVPVIECLFDDLDSGGEPADALTQHSRRLMCALSKHAEQVSVSTFTVPVQAGLEMTQPTFVDQCYAGIAWHIQKSPICFALMAAVALGLARLQSSEVEDNAGFFTTSNVLGADEFYDRVRVSTPHESIELASAKFYASIPKSIEVTEWLRHRFNP